VYTVRSGVRLGGPGATAGKRAIRARVSNKPGGPESWREVAYFPSHSPARAYERASLRSATA
jgi:hypothetical protein